MIVADKKPVEEIIEYLKNHNNVLILGCNECVTVCEAGGQKEVQVLASALRMNALKEGRDVKIDELTLERLNFPPLTLKLQRHIQIGRAFFNI